MANVPSGLSPASAASSTLPTVRLEVRPARGRTAIYEVGDGGFLVGAVPGCDLRLPGTQLPPVLCLIARHAGGASLRKLAPVQPILVNGRQVTNAYLSDGDHLSLGVAEIIVAISAGSSPANPSHPSAPDPGLAERMRQVRTREASLQQLAEQLQQRDQSNDAAIQQKQEILEETARSLRRIQTDLSQQQAELEAREQAVRAAQERMNAQLQLAEGRDHDKSGVRGDQGQTKQQLYERYHERRDRLNKQQQAIRRAGAKLKDRKQRIDEQAKALSALQRQWDQKQADLDASAEQLNVERGLLEEQHRLVASRQQEIQRELAERHSDLQTREHKLADQHEALKESQKQHQSDLVRLDRIQAALEQRQKQLQTRALEVDRRYEQLQRDTRDTESQAVEMDEWHRKLTEQAEQLAQKKKQQEDEAAQINQRAAALEGQQAMLMTLRTRLERIREEVRQQEEALTDQRALHEASQADLKQRLEEAEKLRVGLDNDRQLFDQERKRFEEHRSILEQAVAQLRQARENLAAEEANLVERQKQLDATASDQSEQSALLLSRGQQLEDLHSRLATERQTFKDREAALAKGEATMTGLQEQLRRRAEELDERQKQLKEQEERLEKQIGEWQTQARQADQENQLGTERMESLRQEVAARTAEIDRQKKELEDREQDFQTAWDQMKKAEQELASQKQAIEREHLAWEVEQQSSRDAIERERATLVEERSDFQQLAKDLPELKAHAGAAIERLTRAREQLREQLAEIHSFARQARDQLELAHQQVQVDYERLRQQELAVHGTRDEHRLAVAAFRQQLIEWQGQVSEMKQVLLRDESRLDRRQAEVQQKEQQIKSTSAQLALQAQELELQQLQVTQKHDEMNRHLADMRDWYRRKLRELSGIDLRDVDLPPVSGDPASTTHDDRETTADSAEEPRILSLLGDLEPGDRQLGNLLRTLELIDADTLAALLVEARRQRRSLRQLLLSGNYLTLYQMALIEAGNLDGLVLGPVRLIDRLQATPHEAVYRVFDPRRNAEAVLRVLAEAEMEDAVRPDEFRQRFAAVAAVQQVHIAATLELLEIAGRPAVLQEWLTGLPSSDWPALAAAPGVWFRLLSQAAAALQTAHAAGLLHGNLHPGSFVFTSDGVLKLLGLGEPRWLMQPASADNSEPSITGDLLGLGSVAAGWAALAPRKDGKPKSLPAGLQVVLDRLLVTQVSEGFGSATELLEALDAAGADVPANVTAWERFARAVRDQSSALALRRSA